MPLRSFLTIAAFAIPLSVLPPATGSAAESATGRACIADQCIADAVYQLAPAASLSQARLFDGGTRYSDLLQFGDFGLGALSPLDGEVIIVDGIAFHADEHGRVRELPATATTSFAFLKRFIPERRVALTPVGDYAQLNAALDSALESPNRLYAVRIDGVFERMRLRSVARQRPPYLSLDEVVAAQQTFEAQDIEGTLVGFRFPPYLGAVNAPGWHFHFVSADRRWGGHVLDVAAQTLSADIDETRSFHLLLPRDAGFDAADFGDQESASEGFRRAIEGR